MHLLTSLLRQISMELVFHETLPSELDLLHLKDEHLARWGSYVPKVRAAFPELFADAGYYMARDSLLLQLDDVRLPTGHNLSLRERTLHARTGDAVSLAQPLKIEPEWYPLPMEFLLYDSPRVPAEVVHDYYRMGLQNWAGHAGFSIDTVFFDAARQWCSIGTVRTSDPVEAASYHVVASPVLNPTLVMPQSLVSRTNLPFSLPHMNTLGTSARWYRDDNRLPYPSIQEMSSKNPRLSGREVVALGPQPLIVSPLDFRVTGFFVSKAHVRLAVEVGHGCWFFPSQVRHCTMEPK